MLNSLMAVKDPKQASLEIERIPVARPLSSFWGAMVGWAHYGNREYDRAIRQHQAVVKNEPRHAMSHLLLALNYSQTGQYKAALAECRRVLSLGNFAWRSMPSAMFTQWVRAERAPRRFLSQQRRMLRTKARPRLTRLPRSCSGGGGENEAALDFLEQACDSHDPELLWLKWDPLQLDRLRSYPRFQKLFNRIGLRALPLPPRAETERLSEITKLSA